VAERRKVRLERPPGTLFSERLAQQAVDFFERHLKHTTGRFAGVPFKLLPHQEVDVREIYGRVDEEGNRIIRTAFIEIPKKNGKSEIAAGFANKQLFADGENAAEVYGAAGDRDQASIVFNVAAAMVRSSPQLRKRAKIKDSTKRIVVPGTNSFYRVLSSEVHTKHGFNTSAVIFDEVHTQPNEDLWEVLTMGSGAAREQPLTIAITTAGIPGQSPVAERLHNDADKILRGLVPCPPDFYPVIYGADREDDWTDEEVWRACNPLLAAGVMKLKAIQTGFEEARRFPSKENGFRRLHLNQWVASETRWIPLEAWDKCNQPLHLADLKHLPCYIGLDLSTRRDLTAVVCVWVDGSGNYYILPHFFTPKDALTDRKAIEANSYEQWAKQGMMTLTEGNEIDFGMIQKKIIELSKQWSVKAIAYDPQYAIQLAQNLKETHGLPVVEVRQGASYYNEPCLDFESAVMSRRVRHGGHPVLRWNVDCVMVKPNAEGLIKPVKPDRMKNSNRIDGVVATLMAVFAHLRAPVKRRSVYEERAPLVI